MVRFYGHRIVVFGHLGQDELLAGQGRAVRLKYKITVLYTTVTYRASKARPGLKATCVKEENTSFLNRHCCHQPWVRVSQFRRQMDLVVGTRKRMGREATSPIAGPYHNLSRIRMNGIKYCWRIYALISVSKRQFTPLLVTMPPFSYTTLLIVNFKALLKMGLDIKARYVYVQLRTVHPFLYGYSLRLHWYIGMTYYITYYIMYILYIYSTYLCRVQISMVCMYICYTVCNEYVQL
jgi:hypothetical protein